MTSTLRLIETFSLALWLGSAAVSPWLTSRGVGIARGIAMSAALALIGVATGRMALWGFQPVFVGMALLIAAAGAVSLLRNRGALAGMAPLAIYAAWMSIRGW